MKKLSLYALLCFFSFSTALSQQSADSGTLTGTVITTETGKPLSGANIIILETVMGTASNRDGEFRISNIPAGTYAVQTTVIGYAPRTDSIEIIAGETTNLKITLEQTVLESAQLVVTGSKRSVRVHESPVSIGTILSNEIDLRMPSTIIEILPLEPGVQEVGGQINIRGSSGYSRGAGSRVLVLIDGISVLASDNGGVYWDAIPVEHIENIEILKGAGSALYGSSALGGVINVITKPISEQSRSLFSAQAGWHPFPTPESWRWRDEQLVSGKFHLSHQNTHNRIRYRLGLGYDGSPGYFQNGWYKRWNFLGKVTFTPNQNTKWTTRIFAVDDEHGVFTQWRSAYEPFNTPMESIDDYIETEKIQLAVHYSKIASSKLAHKWRSFYYQTSFQNYLHNSDDYSTAHTYRSEWQTDYQLAANNLITIGIDGSISDIQANIWDNHAAAEIAGYIQEEYRLNVQTKVTAGIRFDYSQTDDFQSKIQVNPKIGLNHIFSDTWSVRASAGRGYRVPSISERFIETQQGLFSVKPNPDLEPEVSWTYEIGTRIELSQWSLDVAGFYNTFENFIEPQPDPMDGRIFFANITDADILGLESSIQFKFPFLPIQQSFGYTFLEPRDLVLDTILAYRHQHEFVSRSTFALSQRLLASIEYQFRSKIDRVQLFPHNPKTGADNFVPIHLWNFNIQYMFDSNLTLRASASNALQYYYVMFERNMGKTQQIQLGLTYIF